MEKFLHRGLSPIVTPLHARLEQQSRDILNLQEELKHEVSPIFFFLHVYVFQDYQELKKLGLRFKSEDKSRQLWAEAIRVDFQGIRESLLASIQELCFVGFLPGR